MRGRGHILSENRRSARMGLVLGFLLTVLFTVLPGFTSAVYGFTAYAAASEERVFDHAGLFTEAERENLEQEAARSGKKVGMDLVILTISDAEGKSAQRYADDYYDVNRFGTGRKHSGVLYLIDMDNREIVLSGLGDMDLYLTDERIGRLLDQLFEEVADGNYAASAELFLEGAAGYVEAGIPEGQYRYDPETGRSEYYRERSIVWYEVVLALAAAGAIALLPCAATANRYQMKAQHRQALNYRLSYRAASAFAFRAVDDKFVNRVVTQRRIPKNTGGGSGSGRGRGGGSSSGRTTMHRSSSGRMHSGGSRKF